MNKIAVSLGVLLVAGSAAFATDRDEPGAATNMAIIQKGDVVTVLYKTEKVSTAKISITDVSGNEIFNDRVKSRKGFSRPYNLTNLADGDYVVKVEDEQGSRTKQLHIGTVKATLDFVYRVVPVRNEDGKYVLLVPGECGVSKIRVNVYNADRNLVYTGTEQVTDDFAKAYMFTGARARGELSFVVTPE